MRQNNKNLDMYEYLIQGYLQSIPPSSPLNFYIQLVSQVGRHKLKDIGKLLSSLAHSRSVLITPIENQEGVRLAKKVFLVQLVGTQLHGCNILQEKTRSLKSAFEDISWQCRHAGFCGKRVPHSKNSCKMAMQMGIRTLSARMA